MVPKQQLAVADRLFGVFTLFLSLYSLFSAHYTIALTTGMIAAAAFVIIRLDNIFDSEILRFLHHWYQPISYTFFYEASCSLNHVLISRNLDPFFQHLDRMLFGLQPSVELAKAIPGKAVAEFFYISYFSYYLLIPILGFSLYCGRRRLFPAFLLRVSAVFYFCYTLFVILPVIGPDTMGVTPPPGYIFHNIMAFIYAHGEIGGGSFPSSHVAVALAVTLAAAKARPRMFRYFFLPDLVFLSIATVYLRYHYAVDVFAGIATTFFIFTLIDRWEKRQKKTGT
ncbi:MAG: phosphatase PAP2 family protein [Acidobacteria bacterium]|nr:phosphatase PAP2 family protein [Acidobacteriota bacterium]